MDPLSVAASIVGILQAIAQITPILTHLITKSKNAPKSIREVQNEVNAIKAALEQLQAFLLRRSAANVSQARWIMIEQIVITLAGCVTTFSELEVFVNSLNSDESLGILDRLKWAAKSSAIIELVAKLQNHKLSLILMLTILQSQSTLEAEESANRLRELVEQVLSSNRLIEQRLTFAEPETTTTNGSLIGFKSETSPAPVISQYPSFRPDFPFEEELRSSWVYQRASNERGDCFSIASAAGRTASWSILSGISLSDVSDIAIVGIPVYEEDIANASHYKFGGPGQDTIVLGEQSPGFKEPSSNVFGVPLSECIHSRYAPSYINYTDGFGEFYTYKPIPRIVFVCGEFLKQNGLKVNALCQLGGRDAPYVRGLQPIFESRHDIFGNIFATNQFYGAEYTVFDCANCLFLYLYSLPEPIVPWSHYEDFCKLKSDITDQVEGDEDIFCQNLELAIRRLPSSHKYLLYYVLDFLVVFAKGRVSNSACTKCLIPKFQPILLSRSIIESLSGEDSIAKAVCQEMINCRWRRSQFVRCGAKGKNMY